MQLRLSSILPAFAAGLGLLFPFSASAVVTYDWVTVGDPGNSNDTVNGVNPNYGAVADTYRIGKYEVTNAQYTEFLNTVDSTGANPNGIYNANMGSNARGGITLTPGAANGSKYSVRANMGNKPVNFVSWYDAARFANWMHNGQGAGSTESGAYSLTGNTGLPTRNSNSTIWLPSEDEWYKAAYYDPSASGPAGADDYWLYPTRSDSAPTGSAANVMGDISNPGTNVANYNFGADWNALDGNVTTVGSAGVAGTDSESYYGTTDQGGNVWEWNESIIGSSRGLRGGSFSDFGDFFLRSSGRIDGGPSIESNVVGFRLASVPEPSSVLMVVLSGLAFLTRRRRPTL